MTSKTRFAVKFGNTAPIPVEKAKYHGATLTKAVDEIRARIDEALEQLSGVTSVRTARKKDFKTRIIRKKERNLFVKIGYGGNNETFSDVLEGYFDCHIRARTALIDARKMLSDGDFDEDILRIIAIKRVRALAARQQKSKLITQPVEKITTFRVIDAEDHIIAAE